MAWRAGSGGASNGPNSASERTSRGSFTAMCWQTIVPMEWPTKWARSMPSTRATRTTASARLPIDSAPLAGERPEPGRSGRTVR